MPEDKIAQIKRLLENKRAELKALETWINFSDWKRGEKCAREFILTDTFEALEAILDENQEPPPMPPQPYSLEERVPLLEERVLLLEEQVAYLANQENGHQKA